MSEAMTTYIETVRAALQRLNPDFYEYDAAWPALDRIEALGAPMGPDVYVEIATERARADNKYGHGRHHDDYLWATILGEEFGEVCRAALPHGEGVEHLREELIQVAAVAVGWIEDVDRRLGVGPMGDRSPSLAETRLREALDAIVGPADLGPFIETYRAAGGGYEGLQAIAREALAEEEKHEEPVPPEGKPCVCHTFIRSRDGDCPVHGHVRRQDVLGDLEFAIWRLLELGSSEEDIRGLVDDAFDDAAEAR